MTEAAAPHDFVDLLQYGAPTPLDFDPNASTRDFEYVVDRRPGLLDGKPGLWWTVNGHMYPDVPMFAVAEGDIVRMTIANHSGEVHPMHLHGHHAVVLARDGEPATGSPWWVDSLNARRRDVARSTSPSWRIIRGSGWTTATTCPTLQRDCWLT